MPPSSGSQPCVDYSALYRAPSPLRPLYDTEPGLAAVGDSRAPHAGSMGHPAPPAPPDIAPSALAAPVQVMLYTHDAQIRKVLEGLCRAPLFVLMPAPPVAHQPLGPADYHDLAAMAGGADLVVHDLTYVRGTWAFLRRLKREHAGALVALLCAHPFQLGHMLTRGEVCLTLGGLPIIDAYTPKPLTADLAQGLLLGALAHKLMTPDAYRLIADVDAL